MPVGDTDKSKPEPDVRNSLDSVAGLISKTALAYDGTKNVVARMSISHRILLVPRIGTRGRRLAYGSSVREASSVRALAAVSL